MRIKTKLFAALLGCGGCLASTGCATLEGNGKYVMHWGTTFAIGHETEVSTPEQKAKSTIDIKPIADFIADWKAD